MRKIILILPEYYQKCTCNITLNTDKTLTTIPDLEQAHETCGGVELF